MNSAVWNSTTSLSFNKCTCLKSGEVCALKVENVITRTAFFLQYCQGLNITAVCVPPDYDTIYEKRINNRKIYLD